MNVKVSVLITFVLLSAIFISCSSKKDEKKDKKSSPPVVVDWVVVKPVSLSEDISISGTIKPFEETVLYSEISGRVTYINLPEGSFVKKNTLLVKVFDDDLQAQLKKSTAQLKIAELTLTRQAELLRVSGISQADYDQTELQTNSLKSDIEVIKAQIRKTEILAPYDGTLGLRNISVGAVVNPSFALVTIRDVQKLKIDFSLPEKYSSDVKIGGKLEFNVQESTEKYEALVIATEQGVDQFTRNLKVRAAVFNYKNKLIPGSFATISFCVNQNQHSILLPTQAIIPQENGKKVVIAQHGKARFVSVKTGLRQNNSIEITDGLSVNDTVITTGVMFVKQDSPIKLRKKKSETKTVLSENSNTNKAEVSDIK